MDMFNAIRFENSLPDGIGVLEVVNAKANRFIPMIRTELDGIIGGPLAELALTQVFQFSKDLFPHVVEALYRFPLPGDAAIKSVTVRFGETELVASLMDRKKAADEYKDALKEGQQAALVTRESPDVFTLRIAGLRPDEEVRVTTLYLYLGDPEAMGFSFRIPLTTSPRYVRDDELFTRNGHGQPLALLKDPGHRFSLNLVCVGGSLVSPTHDLASDHERIRLEGGEVTPDRDCIILWHPPQEDYKATVQMFIDDEDATAFIALVTPPRSSTLRLPREMTLLVDHSGSMKGAKWEAADWAVEKFLRTLTPEDRFNLCLFHSFTLWFSPQPVAGTHDMVGKAIEFLKTGDSGGTEMGLAIREALAQPRDGSGSARHVLLITDAEVTDRARIISMVDGEAKRVDRRRCSVVCIDSAPNSHLAKEIARRGRGMARFLTSDPREVDITTALDEILEMWSAPLLTDAHLLLDRRTVDSDGVDAQGRTRIPVGDLITGQSRWVHGRFIDGGGPTEMSLEGCDATYKVHQAKGIKTILAAERIATLDQLLHARHLNIDPASTLRGLGYDDEEVSRIVGDRSLIADGIEPWKAIRSLLVNESLQNQIICSETAFVAVRKENGEVVQGTLIVPNALPHGWDERFILGSVHMVPPAHPVRNAISRKIGRSEEGTSFKMGRPLLEEESIGSPQDSTVHVFEVTPSWASGRAELCGPEDWSRVTGGKHKRLTGLRLIAPKDLTFGPKAMLLVFIGDMLGPRLKVSVRDLLSQRKRPVNLLVRGDEEVRIELVDPDHEGLQDPNNIVMLEASFGT